MARMLRLEDLPADLRELLEPLLMQLAAANDGPDVLFYPEEEFEEEGEEGRRKSPGGGHGRPAPPTRGSVASIWTACTITVVSMHINPQTQLVDPAAPRKAVRFGPLDSPVQAAAARDVAMLWRELHSGELGCAVCGCLVWIQLMLLSPLQGAVLPHGSDPPLTVSRLPITPRHPAQAAPATQAP